MLLFVIMVIMSVECEIWYYVFNFRFCILGRDEPIITYNKSFQLISSTVVSIWLCSILMNNRDNNIETMQFAMPSSHS